MSFNEFEKVGGVDGPDGGGKQYLLFSAAARILESKEITIDGEPVRADEMMMFVTGFPQYPFFGNLIRRSFSEVCNEFFVQEELGMEEELRLRKSLFALDRLIAYSVINSKKIKNPGKKFIWLSDRIDEAQVNTLAYVLDKHNAQDQLEYYLLTLLDADEELRQLIQPVTTICLPRDVDSLAHLSGNRSENIEDAYERRGPQALSIIGYQWAVRNLPATYGLQTQEENGVWKDKNLLVDQFLANMGIVALGDGDDERAENVIESAIHHKRVGDIGLWETLTEMYPMIDIIDLSKYLDLKRIYHLSREWHYANYFEIDDVRKRLMTQIGGVEHMDRKNILRVLEQNLSPMAGEIMRDFRVSPTFISSINPLITEVAIPRLFGDYTRGYLLRYIKFLIAHTAGTESYLDMLMDISPSIRKFSEA